MYNCQICDTELSTHIKMKSNENALFGSIYYICNYCRKTYITHYSDHDLFIEMSTGTYSSTTISSNLAIAFNGFFVRCSYYVNKPNEISVYIEYMINKGLTSKYDSIVNLDEPINEYKFLEIYRKYYNKAKELYLFI